MRYSSIGVIYLTNGLPNVDKMIALSRKSFSRFHPDIPIHVEKLYHAADFPDKMRWYLGGRIERLLRRFGSPLYPAWGQRSFVKVIEDKMWALTRAPFEINILLDADTILMRPLKDQIALIQEGADVVAFAEPRPLAPGNCELLNRDVKREVNLGAFLYNSRFIESFLKTLNSCEVPFEKLYNVDQALVSLCLDESQELNVSWRHDLQIINDPVTVSTLGFDSLPAFCRAAVEARLNASVFHYIYKKRLCYQSVKRELRSVLKNYW